MHVYEIVGERIVAVSLRQKLTIAVLGVYWPAFFVLAHIPVPDKIRKAGVSDKCLHVLAYMILTFLLWNAVRPGSRVRWRKAAAWLVLAAVLMYGVADEVSQGLVGRSCDVRDLAADACGAVGAMVLMSLAGFRVAGLVVTGCTIFGIANVSRANLADVLPVASSAFYFAAYGVLTGFWMAVAGLLDRGRGKARRAVLAAGVPMAFMAAVIGSSAVLSRTVSGQSVVLSVVGIGAAVLVIGLIGCGVRDTDRLPAIKSGFPPSRE